MCFGFLLCVHVSSCVLLCVINCSHALLYVRVDYALCLPCGMLMRVLLCFCGMSRAVSWRFMCFFRSLRVNWCFVCSWLLLIAHMRRCMSGCVVFVFDLLCVNVLCFCVLLCAFVCC